MTKKNSTTIKIVGANEAPPSQTSPDSAVEKLYRQEIAEEQASALPLDQDAEDGTPSGPLVGAVGGAAIGAVVGGPIGAIVGAAVGAAGGKVAEESNKDDGNTAIGNITDDDSHKVKRTYSGKMYEEGSLADVRRDDVM